MKRFHIRQFTRGAHASHMLWCKCCASYSDMDLGQQSDAFAGHKGEVSKEASEAELFSWHSSRYLHVEGCGYQLWLWPLGRGRALL